MRKNDLIKLLQKVEGNPEVVVWNGYVREHQHVSTKITQDFLTRESFDTYLHQVLLNRRLRIDPGYEFSVEERERMRGVWQKNNSWELASEDYEQTSEFDAEYKLLHTDYKRIRRPVVVLHPKLQGKQMYVRGCGMVQY